MPTGQERGLIDVQLSRCVLDAGRRVGRLDPVEIEILTLPEDQRDLPLAEWLLGRRHLVVHHVASYRTTQGSGGASPIVPPTTRGREGSTFRPWRRPRDGNPQACRSRMHCAGSNPVTAEVISSRDWRTRVTRKLGHRWVDQVQHPIRQHASRWPTSPAPSFYPDLALAVREESPHDKHKQKDCYDE